MNTYNYKNIYIIIRIQICVIIRHEYIHLYEYLYFNILTIIRAIIQSYQLSDMYNYMSTYT